MIADLLTDDEELAQEVGVQLQENRVAISFMNAHL
jgi:hypothetical protein